MWGFPLELLLVKILVGFLTRFDLRKFELRISASQPDLGLLFWLLLSLLPDYST